MQNPAKLNLIAKKYNDFIHTLTFSDYSFTNKEYTGQIRSMDGVDTLICEISVTATSGTVLTLLIEQATINEIAEGKYKYAIKEYDTVTEYTQPILEGEFSITDFADRN